MHHSDKPRDWEQMYKEMPVEAMPWFYAGIEPEVKEALQNLNITGSILDLGTGPGTQATALAKMGYHVTGTDISGTAIEKAKLKAHEEGVSVDFLVDDIVNSNLAGQYDIVFDRGCFHAISPEKRNTYVSQVYNLVKDGGYLLLKCFSHKEEGRFGPQHRLSPEEIKEYFQNQFEILSIDETVFLSNRGIFPKALFCVMKRKQ